MSHFLQTGDTEQKLGMFLNRKKKEGKKEKKNKMQPDMCHQEACTRVPDTNPSTSPQSWSPVKVLRNAPQT